MASPNDRRYASTHEWHKLEGQLIVVGLSQFAVDELTDITFVDVTRASGPIKAGQAFGEIESVKTTSELYCGLDGTVAEVNTQVVQNPALVNQDPYGQGWLIKVKPADPAQLEKLLSAAAYDQSAAHH
ncbi:MAG: glycine cleavage system protein GcvH [Phycisphaeraceae bacterium]|nr:glycine cleavage system protein GcvH [Phycisphaeraceae bacterium]